MKKSIFVLAIATLSLTTACKSTQDILMTNIPADAIVEKTIDPTLDPAVSGTGIEIPGIPGLVTLTPEMNLAADAIRASGANPVCGQFNMNSLAALSDPTKGKIPGIGILKVIAVGAISGATGGLVSELGIGSEFVETAVAGTVNQVVYNTSKPIIDGLLPSGQDADTVAEIYTAADSINCAKPAWAEALSPKDAKILLAYLTAEFSPSVPTIPATE